MDGAVSIRVPYGHLNEAELELVELNGEIEDRNTDRTPRRFPVSDSSTHLDYSASQSVGSQGSSLKTLIFGSMVGAGVQFGWALQLSLLTPYIQTLGIEHAFSSFIWLCGPITGFIVQPCVGVWSDKCNSKYGRRRPFIVAGCMLITLAVFFIGFAADIGYLLGDTQENCDKYKGPRWRASAVFIFGFWMLDLANNTVQGPARALLADLSGPDQRSLANAIFCSWMSVGNILGFSSGASGNWHRLFPFLASRACCEACVNLKAAFLVAVAFLMFCMLVTIYYAKEVPLEVGPLQRLSDSSPLLSDNQQNNLEEVSPGARPVRLLSDSAPLLKESQQNGFVLPNEIFERAEVDQNYENHVGVHKSNSGDVSLFNSNVENDEIEAFKNGPSAVLVNILTSLRHLPPGMHSVLIVMALTWVRISTVHISLGTCIISMSIKRLIKFHFPSLFPLIFDLLVSQFRYCCTDEIIFLFNCVFLCCNYHEILYKQLSWFPFFLFDTDWMGREVYHGNPKGNANEMEAYQNGVREGSFGLLLNSVVLGMASLLIEPMCQRIGAKLLWALSNFIVFVCMSATTVVSLLSSSEHSKGIQHVIGANQAIKVAALVIFSLLGFPLAITYSVPFSVTAELTADSGGGQGLATGVLNLAIVVPQMIVSLGAGPWDAFFGGGNIPAFALAAIFSLVSFIVAILKLPTISSSSTSTSFHGFG